MSYWLANSADQMRSDHVKRFDARLWTINFPRPMMASATTPTADELRIDAVFYKANDLMGVIWWSEDSADHPLLSYETSRDYSGQTLRFRWQANGGIKPLDAVNGPVLTIEGRDAQGAPRTWYVRLWNYATGTPADAEIELDFSALDGGFLLPGEADPVWPGDIDRMFISLVPSAYDGTDTPLAVPENATVQLSSLRSRGPTSTLAIGDVMLPVHDLRMAGGYDDVYNLTPERVLRNCIQLGYRGTIDHYVGMSHYFRLYWDAAASAFLVDPGAAVLNTPCLLWHIEFIRSAQALGYQLIFSISFELLDAHCPAAWKQRAHDGSRALTGWQPPSTLLSPCHPDAMEYLRDVARAFVSIAKGVGASVHIQIGEPWWWTGYGAQRVPCFYDAATEALYISETGRPVPTRHVAITEVPDAGQQLYLDWLGAKLAAATASLTQAVKALDGQASVSLLFFTPQVLDAGAPMLASVNMPAGWAAPAFDRLQLEDYDHVIADDRVAHRSGLAQAQAALGYTQAQTDYFAGFVLDGNDSHLWARINWAIDDALDRSMAQVFVWAYPQVVRDGFTYTRTIQEEAMAFHDVSFPLEISYGASVAPRFQTSVVETASGLEFRNVNWSDARLEYDAGIGVRALSDLEQVLRFFRARFGRAYAFRFRDPLDHSSTALDEPVSALDQLLGTGDGTTSRFALVKTYRDPAGVQVRRIWKPVPATVKVALAGVAQITGWTLDADQGAIEFDSAPPAGVDVTAGFLFDVPVRFASDTLETSLATFQAGEVPAIPLVEVKLDA